jgi:PTS system mannose-specific IIC component
MLGTALLAMLAAFISIGGNYLFGQCMSERPLVAGFIAGLIFGDVGTGVIVGAALEAIFMGAVNVGGAVTAEPVTATTLAVVFVVVMHMDQGVAIALAVPIGLLAGLLYEFIHLSLSSLGAPFIDRAAASGKEKNIKLVHFLGWFIKYTICCIPTFLGVLLGAEPVSQMIDQVPDTVIAGFTASGNLLPAIGMAMLLKMLWDKKLAVYFLLGFILVSYLSLDMVGVAAFAFVIVVVAVLRDKQNLDLQHKFKSKALPISSSKDDDEEAFFA